MRGFLGSDFLVGDSAYPCLKWLIPPFRDNGRLTRSQDTFNYKHSSSKAFIENTFGLLNGRFRRLKSFENSNVLFITKCVVASFTTYALILMISVNLKNWKNRRS
nr:unnamed protein product [Callosobruchus analis]